MRYRPARLPPSAVSGSWSAVMVLLLTLPAFAQDRPAPEININDLLSETQQHGPDPSRVTMVWWMPEEFWRISFEQAPMASGPLEETLNLLRPYVVFAVVDGTLGPFGGAAFRDPKTLRDLVVLVDKTGTRHVPLPEDQLAADIRMMASMLKPAFATLVGEMGQNMEIFFFAATASDGTRIADASSEGRFTLELGDLRFDWRTPLASVLPRKICPVDERELNGAWTFCPWHGERLVAKSSGG